MGLDVLIRRGSSVGLGAVALALALALPMAAVAKRAQEHALKAAFVYRIATFVEWPASALDGDAAPLVIGVLADDDFRQALAEAVHGRQVDGHPVVLAEGPAQDEGDPLHVLYVSETMTERLPEILRLVAARPVLTVGDVPRFARQGGMVGLVGDGARVRLEVNHERVLEADLHISSKLLRLATVVGS